MQIEAISKANSPEIACVVLCCRIFIKTASAEELEQFVQAHEMDWDEVYKYAAFHRVRPILYKVLDNCKIPAPVLGRFRNYCRALSVFAFERQVESARIQQVLGQQGIVVRMYKGLDFTKLVYGGDIGMREFTDMDMMIDSRQLPELAKVMTAEGYECSQIEYLRRFPEHYVANKKDICFYKRSPMGKLFGFEFHHRPGNFLMDQSIGFRELLGQDYLHHSAPFSQEQYYRLMLLNHGASDYFPNLRSLVDMALLSQKGIGSVPEQLRRVERLSQELSMRLLDGPAAATPADNVVMRCATRITKLQLTVTLRSVWERRYMHIRFSASFSDTFRMAMKFLHYLMLPNELDINGVQLFSFKLYYLAKMVRCVNFPGRFKKVFSRV
ncbi:nucleotidyltransferase family protein [Chitinophaga silvisoli]|uniref:Nucleotidyltransferase family protein n=1 Tax=Chitinophaga silvisoli TaxID=2291814 RepID=A0A3E1NX75_9BACT|nr:nucleotidyltransferase family protein [Chitinophaga silvisoli]RFM32529.1 hypothetical protein DXN04_22865 [Chitinophaga silvisoli]